MSIKSQEEQFIHHRNKHIEKIKYCIYTLCNTCINTCIHYNTKSVKFSLNSLILCPLLYIIYMNNISIPNCNVHFQQMILTYLLIYTQLLLYQVQLADSYD